MPDKLTGPLNSRTIANFPQPVRNFYNRENIGNIMLPVAGMMAAQFMDSQSGNNGGFNNSFDNQRNYQQQQPTFQQQTQNFNQPQNNFGQYQAPQTQNPYSGASTTQQRVLKQRSFGNGQECRKGQKVQLPFTQNLRVCVGWDIKDTRCDVDISSFMLNDTRKVIGDDWFVFYGMTTSPDGACTLDVNGTQHDDKCVNINMTKLNPAVSRIVFVLTIDEALSRGLNFSMIKDAYIRVLDGNNELYRFKLTEYYAQVTSMMLGEIYKHNGAWKFAPIGDGVGKDLAGLCQMYGVQTD